ncbi:MAG TPA: hypothetical protein VLV83_04890 [Acidobacteriota bacterium]|nr:hypothetical protein [Acidobacteriota bacterium]
MIQILASSFVLAALLAGGPPQAMKEDLVSHLEGYLSSIRNHEMEGALAHLAPDFQLRFEGSPDHISRQGMRDILGWDMAVGSQVEKLSCRLEGERTLRCRLREANRVLDLLGVEELFSDNRLEFDGQGRIRRHVSRVEEHEPSWQDQMAKAVEWLSEHHPKGLEKVRPGGKAEFSTATAQGWLTLLRRWREATGGS